MTRLRANRLAVAWVVTLWAVPTIADDAIHVGQEVLLLESGPGEGIQHSPHVAFGDGLYLAVWQEGWHGEGGRSRIYAARVSADGKVLDPSGICVAPAEEGVQESPRVAWAAGVFFVVWQDLRGGKDADVFGARVSRQGNLLDAKPLLIAGGPGTQALPDVAGDGHDFLVVWQSFDRAANAYQGFAVRATPDGELADPVTTGAAPQPRIAWSGDAYLAVYGDRRVTSVKLDRDGRPINPSKWGHEVVRNVRWPRPAVTGIPARGWLVVVHRSLPDYWGWGGPGGMRCYLVTPEGKLDPSLGPQLKADRAGNWSRLPNWLDAAGRDAKTWPWGQCACVWDGRHVVAVWPRHHVAKKVMLADADLYAARVDGWAPIDQEGIAVAASESEEQMPALASDRGGRLFCVYERLDPDGRALIAGRILRSR